MTLLCDVHISFKVVNYLKSIGVDALHVNAILEKWHTKDKDICIFADLNDLIVLTKDVDFKNSFMVNHTPLKLIKVSLGNISNNQLIQIIGDNIQAIQMLNSVSKRFMIEIDQHLVTFFKAD